jgi:hypothetical protein
MKQKNISSVRENEIYNWIDGLLPIGELSNGERRNLIYHIIGTDRAFGIFFPEFFLYEIPEKKVSSFFKLFIASRAYLIAHDALKDEDRTNEIRDILRKSEPLFREECIKHLQNCIGENETIEKIMNLRDEITNKAYSYSFDKKVPDMDFACERVSYWYIVFDALDSLGVDTKKIQRLFDLSLFLLQLADDFSDIEEDYKKKNNCNLLGWNEGNKPSIENKHLEKYTLISIWLTAKQVIEEFEDDDPISKWAQEIIDLIIFSDEKELLDFCNKTFSENWPKSYLPPHVNPKLDKSTIPNIRLNSMNGVKISAESINSFATNRTINKIKELILTK